MVVYIDNKTPEQKSESLKNSHLHSVIEEQAEKWRFVSPYVWVQGNQAVPSIDEVPKVWLSSIKETQVHQRNKSVEHLNSCGARCRSAMSATYQAPTRKSVVPKKLWEVPTTARQLIEVPKIQSMQLEIPTSSVQCPWSLYHLSHVSMTKAFGTICRVPCNLDALEDFNLELLVQGCLHHPWKPLRSMGFPVQQIS